MAKKQFRKCLTVGQLIEQLSKYPKDMLVGRHGHFGEFYEMSPEYSVSTAESYLVPDGASWRDMSHTKVRHIEIDVPNIGEEPN